MIKIDDEFKNIMPELTPEEFKTLEDSILKEGVRDNLIIWQEENILIDGHNRYNICLKHGLDYGVTNRSFNNREEVKRYIYEIGLGRRNLSKEDFSLFIGRIYNSEKQSHGGQIPGSGHYVHSLEEDRTSDKLAKKFNINSKTVRRNGKLVENIEILGTEAEELYRNNKLKKSDVNKLAQEESFTLSEKRDIIQAKKKNPKVNIRAEINIKKTNEELKNISDTYIPKIKKQDCITWLNSLDTQCDLLLTDPPYSTDVEDLDGFVSSWLPLALSKVKSSGRAFVFIGAYPNELKTYIEVANSQSYMELDQILVWTYRNIGLPNIKNSYKHNWQAILHFNGSNCVPLNEQQDMNELFSVQDVNAPDGRIGDRYHSWQKPNELARRLISHTTDVNDTVFDCFIGTGTFCIEASKLKRHSYGCDTDDEVLQLVKKLGCEIIE